MDGALSLGQRSVKEKETPNKLKLVCLDMPSPVLQRLFIQMGQKKSLFDSIVQTAISNMLLNTWSIARHKRSNGVLLHPDRTPDVLTCGLPLGKVRSGRESEMESAHFSLILIQFFSAWHPISQHTITCIHN